MTSHRSRGRRSASRAAACLLAAVVTPIVLHAQLNILTNRYDPQRTGANLVETTLTAANVNVGRFGKLYSYPVDGAVYAQPLYVSGVTIGGTLHNVLYVATMNDKLYAFDADSPSPSPLWVVDFTNPPAITPVPITDIASPNLNIVGNVGIHGTPVIDRAAGTIYFVARTKESGAIRAAAARRGYCDGTGTRRKPGCDWGDGPGKRAGFDDRTDRPCHQLRPEDAGAACGSRARQRGRARRLVPPTKICRRTMVG